MVFSYAITLSSFLKLGEKFETTLENLNEMGISNLEMYGEPEEINSSYFKDIFSVHRMRITGITGMWGKSSRNGWKRRLLSKDPGLVKYSEDYVISCIKLCDYFGGDKINICLFSDPINLFDVTHSNVILDEKIKLIEKCVPVLNNLSSIARDHNIDLIIEPLNRYSTPYCCNLEDASILLNNCPQLQLMLDTFHMNIEEDSFSHTIMKAKDWLVHMHFADNNRKMPGEGHIDFRTIIIALKKISFTGFISFEPIISFINYQKKIKYGLDFIKNLDSKY